MAETQADSFASVKARWAQNAKTFGSPLPTSNVARLANKTATNNNNNNNNSNHSLTSNNSNTNGYMSDDGNLGDRVLRGRRRMSLQPTYSSHSADGVSLSPVRKRGDGYKTLGATTTKTFAKAMDVFGRKDNNNNNRAPPLTSSVANRRASLPVLRPLSEQCASQQDSMANNSNNGSNHSIPSIVEDSDDSAVAPTTPSSPTARPRQSSPRRSLSPTRSASPTKRGTSPRRAVSPKPTPRTPSPRRSCSPDKTRQKGTPEPPFMDRPPTEPEEEEEEKNLHHSKLRTNTGSSSRSSSSHTSVDATAGIANNNNNNNKSLKGQHIKPLSSPSDHSASSSSASSRKENGTTPSPAKRMIKKKVVTPSATNHHKTKNGSTTSRRLILGRKRSVNLRSGKRRRTVIYGTSAQQLRGQQMSHSLPVYARTDAEEDAILQALYNKQDALFSTVRVGKLSTLVSAFEKVEYDAGDIVMEQGSSSDYFYVMDRGLVEFTVDEFDHVGTAGRGGSFGELGILYDTPRAATVLALEDCTMYRVDAMSFKSVLSAETQRCHLMKHRLLQGIRFLEYMSAQEVLKLSKAMVPRIYQKSETIVKAGATMDAFYILAQGRLKSKSRAGSTLLNVGEYFGDASLVTGETADATLTCMTQCMVFVIHRETFETVLGSISSYILRDQDVRRLSAIPFLHTTSGTASALASLLREKVFVAGESIFVEKETCKAALYLVREGSVTIKDKKEIGPGGSFGEAIMKRAIAKSKKSTKSPYSITANSDCTCAMLTLRDYWSACDPGCLKGKKDETGVASVAPAAVTVDLKLGNLKKHSILGEGAFGQVWLVSDKTGSTDRAFALKIQSKAHLVRENQVEAVIQEKVLLDRLQHPFLINLVSTYQNENYIYMLMDFVQGGELFSLMHEDSGKTLPEKQAKFYALCIADVLSYLHRGKYVYRDLKPENVMIDGTGYVKLIDFGFCKYLLAEKTYTLCGTPGYLPPEAVNGEGHNCCADYWALGVLIYEMLAGESPFYYEGISQPSLFESIINDPFEPPSAASKQACDIMDSLLNKDPLQRLGCRNETEIVSHEWFAEFDLEALRSRAIKPPWMPEIEDPLDTSCFNDWSDLENADQDDSQKPGKLSPRDAQLFEGVF